MFELCYLKADPGTFYFRRAAVDLRKFYISSKQYQGEVLVRSPGIVVAVTGRMPRRTAWGMNIKNARNENSDVRRRMLAYPLMGIVAWQRCGKFSTEREKCSTAPNACCRRGYLYVLCDPGGSIKENRKR